MTLISDWLQTKTLTSYPSCTVRLILGKDSKVQDLQLSSNHLNTQTHQERPGSARPSLCFIPKSKPLLAQEQNFHRARAQWLSSLEHRPVHQKIGFDCQSGHIHRLQTWSPVGTFGRQPINIFLSHWWVFPLFLPLSQNGKYPQVKNNNKKEFEKILCTNKKSHAHMGRDIF